MNGLIKIVCGLALGGAALLPAQARASDEDIARALAGIAAVAIVAKIIDDRKDRKAAAETVSTSTRAGRLGSIEQTYPYDGRRIIDGRVRPYDEQRHGPKAGRGYKKAPLPEACLRWVETERGDRLAYGSDCLDRRYKFASKLPQSCETVVRTPRGFQAVYGARCLDRDGWEVARR